MAKDFPPSGLYVTTRPLEGHEERVPAGVLVRFRDAAERGAPMVQVPVSFEDNRWIFSERGYIVRDAGFVAGLSPRPEEGYYILNRTVHVTEMTIIPQRTLVQLSYSRAGQPILYVGRFEGNAIVFPKAGYKFAADILGFLDDAGFRPPTPLSERQLH